MNPLRPLALALLLVACKRAPSDAIPTDQEYASASAPPIQIAAGMGACDDLATCERECDAGAADRCRRLGVSYEFGQGGVKRDPKQAIAWYERSCELGNPTGCEAAGRMYEYHVEPKDMTKAAGLYERACKMGWQGGCANFAIMLENGRGVPRDLAKARELYAGACKAGAGLACDRLKALGDAG